MDDKRCIWAIRRLVVTCETQELTSIQWIQATTDVAIKNTSKIRPSTYQSVLIENRKTFRFDLYGLNK
ncbi:MAG TPA: hypothetical protein DDZ51_04230 [Planctomycetaceae bacterium]|nr:hypothetical protein [Planctomycetaceae bacterium]